MIVDLSQFTNEDYGRLLGTWHGIRQGELGQEKFYGVILYSEEEAKKVREILLCLRYSCEDIQVEEFVYKKVQHKRWIFKVTLTS